MAEETTEKRYSVEFSTVYGERDNSKAEFLGVAYRTDNQEMAIEVAKACASVVKMMDEDLVHEAGDADYDVQIFDEVSRKYLDF